MEEGTGLKGKARVTGPSKEEYEEHMRSHMPFRSWCEFCVKGKSKACTHKKKGENVSRSNTNGGTNNSGGLHLPQTKRGK